MTRFPSVTGKDLVRALELAGFEVVRIRGSHQFLHHPTGRRTVIPVHAGEELGPGLLAKILRDAELTKDEVQAFL